VKGGFGYYWECGVFKNLKINKKCSVKGVRNIIGSVKLKNILKKIKNVV
jgi:hypothetical protein